MTNRTTNLLIYSNVHYVHLAEIKITTVKLVTHREQTNSMQLIMQ